MKHPTINACLSVLLMISLLMGSSGAIGCECQDTECCLELEACDYQNSFSVDSSAHSGDYDCCSVTEGVNSTPQNSHNHVHLYSTFRLLNNPPLITSTLFLTPEPIHDFSSFQDTPILRANCFLYSSKTTSLQI